MSSRIGVCGDRIVATERKKVTCRDCPGKYMVWALIKGTGTYPVCYGPNVVDEDRPGVYRVGPRLLPWEWGTGKVKKIRRILYLEVVPEWCPIGFFESNVVHLETNDRKLR